MFTLLRAHVALDSRMKRFRPPALIFVDKIPEFDEKPKEIRNIKKKSVFHEASFKF